jgi:hypothetical protein
MLFQKAGDGGLDRARSEVEGLKESAASHWAERGELHVSQREGSG